MNQTTIPSRGYSCDAPRHFVLEKLDQTIGIDETVLACSMHLIGCKTLCGTDRFWREDTVLQTRVSQTVFKLVSVIHIIEQMQKYKLSSCRYFQRAFSHQRDSVFNSIYLITFPCPTYKANCPYIERRAPWSTKSNSRQKSCRISLNICINLKLGTSYSKVDERKELNYMYDLMIYLFLLDKKKFLKNSCSKILFH